MGLRLAPGSFLGSVEKYVDQSDHVYSETAYASREQLAKHRHAHSFFYLVIEGGCLDFCSGRTMRADKGTLVFHAADEDHANQWASGGGKCFNIDLAPRILAPFQQLGAPFHRSLELKGGRAAALALSIHHEFHRGDLFSPLSMDGLTVELLATVGRLSSKKVRHAPRWLLRAREMLCDTFDCTPRLTQIAVEVGVHPAHLSRTFRIHFGQTPGDYLRRLRVEAAANLLRQPSLSISEIALRTGFSDQSNLSRSFAREYNISPAAYRHACAKK
jgi:AraC family transcriptional regulator